MMITITPFTADKSCDCSALLVGHEREKHVKRNHIPITYRGIYLDDKYISYRSIKQILSKMGVAGLIVMFLVASFGFSAQAAETQLAKKGTATGTSAWTSPGEIKEVGKDHLYWAGVFWGMSFNDNRKGFLDDTAWYCPGVNEIINGIHHFNGYCTLTDMDGDKIYLSYRSLPYDGKGPVPTEGKYSGGTGKYTSIQGSYTFLCRPLGSQFVCDFKANYQLP